MAVERISNQQLPAQVEREPIKPPLPKAVYKVMNPLMAAIIRSPFHQLMSNSLMLLIFEGRKSGRRFIIPVGFIQEGNRLFVFTHSNWYKNLQDDAPVAVRLRGELVRGVANVMEDPAEIAKVVRRIVSDLGEAMARRMGLIGDEGPDLLGPPSAPVGAVFMEIKLANG